MLDALKTVSLLGLAAYVVTSLLQAFVRAVRFRVLISSAGDDDPGMFHTLLVTLVRNMTVDMLPSRAGELSYIAMMNRGHRVSGEACVSSLSISFLFDLIALLFILAAATVPGVISGAQSGKGLIGVLAVVFLAAAVGSVLIFSGLGFCCRIARRMFGESPRARLIAGTLSFLEKLNDAVTSTRRQGIALKLLGLSLGVRLAKYAGLYALFLAVTSRAFPQLAAEPVWNVIFALVGAEAAGSLPVPSFMSFGTYEAGGTLALTVLGYSAAMSLVTVGVVHIYSQLVDYTLGGIGFLLFSATVERKTSEVEAPQRSTRPLVWACVLGLLLLGLAFAAVQVRKAKKLGSLKPPESGEEVNVTAEEKRAAAAVIGGTRGFVAWSSNRNGNHDIYMMDLPSRKIRRLTTHENAEYFARISPDGKRLVFSRCHVKWSSQRDPMPWSVVLYDLETGKERELAARGNTPTWTEDGKYVVFQRDGSQVVSVNVETGQEEVLFSPSGTGYSEKMIMQTPSYSVAKKALAVTMRGADRAVSVWNMDGEIRKYFGGCQITWAPDSAYLYYVDKGGRMQNVIYKIDPESGTRTKWLDMPGDYSHEYFPRVSGSGDTLVFGACATGHEHDTADYEIFLWKIGDPPGKAVRLTHHTGNDCWPDVFVR